MKILEQLKYIVIHCTAGFGDIDSIIKFWREKLRWDGNGYSIIVDLAGQRWYLTKDKTYSRDIKDFDFTQVTNGVLRWNDICIHISYIGGVDINNYKIAKDTRTPAQKLGLEKAIYDVLAILDQNGVDITKDDLGIVGHRDFSPDKDGSGVIESWERIKECPSFDAINEYKWILSDKAKLPTR